jgi:hypothetical protein
VAFDERSQQPRDDALADLTERLPQALLDAQWYGAEEGQLCDGRKAITEVMSRNLAGRVRGRIEETIQDGSRVIVAFRPEQPGQLDRPVDDGIAYVVVTIRDGHIIELKGCADRAMALAYVQADGQP